MRKIVFALFVAMALVLLLASAVRLQLTPAHMRWVGVVKDSPSVVAVHGGANRAVPAPVSACQQEPGFPFYINPSPPFGKPSHGRARTR